MSQNFFKKYGFNIFNQSLEERFKYAATQGMNHIEINLSRDKFKTDIFNGERFKQLKNFAESNKIELSIHIPYYINISDILLYSRKFSVKYLTEAIWVASELKATHITLHLGSFFWFPFEQWERKKALNRFIKSLSRMIKTCEEKKVIIALENVVPIPAGSEYYLLGDNIEDFSFVFSNIQSDYLKFCLDTGHANMAEGVFKYIENFKDKLHCMHIHDNNGTNDEHLPVGAGSVPWAELANELKKIDFRGPVISECRNVSAHEAVGLFEQYFID